MIVGADENAIVTQPRIDVATQQTGHSIEFWGRYFKNPGQHVAGAVSAEQGGCAPQSKKHPGASHRTPDRARRGLRVPGRADGTTNAKAIIGAFGTEVLSALPHGLVVFLDVEGPPNPSLSIDYYKGCPRRPRSNGTGSWRQAPPGSLRTTRGQCDVDTSGAGRFKRRAAGEGTWIARPGTLGCHPLRPFNELFVRPQGLPQSIKVLAWQAVLECHNLDFSILNPAFEAETLGKFVLPAVPQPAAVAAVPKPRAAPKARKKRTPKPKTGRTARKKRAAKSKTKRTARKKGSRAKRR